MGAAFRARFETISFDWKIWTQFEAALFASTVLGGEDHGCIYIDAEIP